MVMSIIFLSIHLLYLPKQSFVGYYGFSANASAAMLHVCVLSQKLFVALPQIAFLYVCWYRNGLYIHTLNGPEWLLYCFGSGPLQCPLGNICGPVQTNYNWARYGIMKAQHWAISEHMLRKLCWAKTKLAYRAITGPVLILYLRNWASSITV